MNSDKKIEELGEHQKRVAKTYLEALIKEMKLENIEVKQEGNIFYLSSPAANSEELATALTELKFPAQSKSDGKFTTFEVDINRVHTDLTTVSENSAYTILYRYIKILPAKDYAELAEHTSSGGRLVDFVQEEGWGTTKISCLLKKGKQDDFKKIADGVEMSYGRARRLGGKNLYFEEGGFPVSFTLSVEQLAKLRFTNEYKVFSQVLAGEMDAKTGAQFFESSADKATKWQDTLHGFFSEIGVPKGVTRIIDTLSFEDTNLKDFVSYIQKKLAGERANIKSVGHAISFSSTDIINLCKISLGEKLEDKPEIPPPA